MLEFKTFSIVECQIAITMLEITVVTVREAKLPFFPNPDNLFFRQLAAQNFTSAELKVLGQFIFYFSNLSS